MEIGQLVQWQIGSMIRKGILLVYGKDQCEVICYQTGTVSMRIKTTVETKLLNIIDE